VSLEKEKPHMSLYVDPVDYKESMLEQWIPSGSDYPLVEKEGGLKTFSISTAPIGKHPLSECAHYEARWRTVASSVVLALKGETDACIVWANGPFESAGLLPLLKYVECWNENGSRYHIEGFTYPGGHGYYTSWISFEFDVGTFDRMVRDDSIDFELARLAMVICDPRLVDAIISRGFGETRLMWILKHKSISLAFTRHFEGLYLVGPTEVVDARVARVREWLSSQGLGQ
jgi:hypothetical protein